MFPEGFVKRIRNQDYIDTESLLRALSESSPVSIRINPDKWQKVPANSQPVPWCKKGFYLDSRPSFTLDPLFHSGCYYPQEASSMFLEEIFLEHVKASGKVRVLDLCAAPGGKSTHLSSLLGDNGLLVSNEVIRSRASVLAGNLTRWGASNTIVTQNDPSDFGKLPGFFDVILVDAPCSGEGMFRDQEIRNEWSEQNTVHCAERQKRILLDIWPCLRENGILIYSTCTFNPAENEHNIKWLSEKVNAESLTMSNIHFPGVSGFKHMGINCYGFHPDRIKGEGFFFSVMKKKEDNRQNLLKKEKMTGFSGLNSEELSIAMKLASFPENRLIKTGEVIVAAPENHSDIQILFRNLRLIKTGTELFSVKKQDFLPSHELALSGGLRQTAFPATELDHEQAVQYLKRGNPVIKNAPKGWFVVKFKGINLGFAKNIGIRINNYYPVGWRIRMAVPEKNLYEVIQWEN